ncbi:hypothetical protein AAFF_G00114520 [Aldrovandia affinis]|uniref:Uncharacterized protein n=1 Tax=Aldrovandia affinis TaxID=143900 RepID=A0AAD7RST7_9TELE|nr:hypothetical protein AAFF_G00114520 [Aldrovandia affinis]
MGVEQKCGVVSEDDAHSSTSGSRGPLGAPRQAGDNTRRTDPLRSIETRFAGLFGPLCQSHVETCAAESSRRVSPRCRPFSAVSEMAAHVPERMHGEIGVR